MASLRFSPVSYTNKTYRHGITEILYSILYLIHGYSLAIKCKTISKLLDETVEYSALMVFISFKLDKKQILNETFFLKKVYYAHRNFRNFENLTNFCHFSVQCRLIQVLGFLAPCCTI